MMADQELKPCPCCGSENVAFYTGLPDGYYEGAESFGPSHCPFSAYDENPEWEQVEPMNITNPGFQRLLDWFMEDGYEKASPALRDTILANGFELKSWVDGAGWATELLGELEATSPCLSWSVWEELKTKVKKIGKPNLVAATWNRAFQVGLMMAEKIRVELEERQKNHKPPFDNFDY